MSEGILQKQEKDGHRHGAKNSTDAVFYVQATTTENKSHDGNIRLRKNNVEMPQKRVQNRVAITAWAHVADDVIWQLNGCAAAADSITLHTN